ncbi:hypothetical protein ACFL25_00475 [Patescibacteria group bacterium]
MGKNIKLVSLLAVILLIGLFSLIYFQNVRTPKNSPVKHEGVEKCLSKHYFEEEIENESYKISLNSRIFTPRENKEAVECLSLIPAGKSHYLFVQLKSSGGNTELRNKLKSQGVELLGYVPENAWFAKFEGKTKSVN